MTPDEILRIPPDEELVFIRGENVFRAHRFDYSKHTHYKKLKSTKSIYYEPDWKRNADSQALSYTKPAIYDEPTPAPPPVAIPQATEPTPEQSLVDKLGLSTTNINEIMKKGR